MKKFDVTSIVNRQIASLSEDDRWKSVIDGGAVDAVIKSDAEARAELARYFEYIMQEVKWNTCRNTSSVLAQTPFLGYKPRRRTSAIGYVMVSHNPALRNAGLPGLTTMDSITASLTDEYSGVPFTFFKGTQLTTTVSGAKCVITENVSYTVGMKYVMVPVVEGTLKSETVTVTGNPFEVIRIQDTTVEANSTQSSGKFLSVRAPLLGSGIDFVEFDSVFLATKDEYAFDVNSNNLLTETVIRFGNGIAGKRVPPNTRIDITYLSSNGGTPYGNVATFQKWVPDSLDGFTYVNIDALSGSKGVDTIDEIKAKAPKQYLIDGSIVTSDNYEALIESLAVVLRAKVFYGVYTDPLSSAKRDAILYTAIDTLGRAFSTSSIEALVLSEIKGRNNPLDFYKYSPPKFLHLRLNVSGDVSTTGQATQEAVKSYLYDKYKTTNQEFFQTFDVSQVRKEVIEVGEGKISKVAVNLEVIQDIEEATFAEWPTNTNYYVASFEFDPSYVELYKAQFTHCLRIDIFMPCSSCEPKRRTLMLIATNTSPFYTVKQFNYITEQYDTTNTVWTQRLLANLIDEYPELTDESNSVLSLRKIPFLIDLDMNTFTSVSLTTLAKGSIFIPIEDSLGTPYFDFPNSPSESYPELIVQVIAQPTNSTKVVPLFEDNIFRIDGGTPIHDIRVGGLTNVDS